MRTESAALSGLEALECRARVKSLETFNRAATLTNLEYREIRFHLFQRSPVESSRCFQSVLRSPAYSSIVKFALFYNFLIQLFRNSHLPFAIASVTNVWQFFSP